MSFKNIEISEADCLSPSSSDKASVTSSPANSMPQTPISSAHSYGRSPAMSNSHKSPFADVPKHRSPASHTEQHEIPKAPSRASNLGEYFSNCILSNCFPAENLPSDDGELSDSNSSDSDSPLDSSSSDESDEFTVDMDFIQKVNYKNEILVIINHRNSPNSPKMTLKFTIMCFGKS